ncbi:peptide ABC transporter ATP-binding protein [Kiloniella spongiae]|uniref:Peptide ABC transporter ATP-binding protein n=1 Tax=Kiloniella spongiae TaxID=1489064 RepID=A0A0H2MJ41_9PROT|nr:DMT family transporter [Kiloniella spongiae]KLN60772.1 peptide ABC transporter ATP-binding protein [Kiloniella spongiae]
MTNTSQENSNPGNSNNGNSNLLAILAPCTFVLIWSTGFVFAKMALPYAETMTLLATRFLLAVGLLLLISLIWKAKWPRDPMQILHIAVAGILLHAIYLGGVFASIELGLQAGVAALIVGIQPLLVAFAAGVFLKEKITTRQWIGLILGVSGVILVVWAKLENGLGTPLGVSIAVVALFGISIGTVYQKRFCGEMDLRTGAVIQYAAASIPTGILAYFTESMIINWAEEMIFAMFWLVVVLSVGAISLLYILIRKGAASKVSSMFFLVPPTAALMAWVLYDETFRSTALVGMAMTVIGVALVNLRPIKKLGLRTRPS